MILDEVTILDEEWIRAFVGLADDLILCWAEGFYGAVVSASAYDGALPVAVDCRSYKGVLSVGGAAYGMATIRLLYRRCHDSRIGAC